MDHWWTREPCCAMNVVELSYVVEERWTHREQVSPAARSRNRLPDRLIDQSINQGRTRTLVSRQTHASTLHRRQKKRGFFFLLVVLAREVGFVDTPLPPCRATTRSGEEEAAALAGGAWLNTLIR